MPIAANATALQLNLLCTPAATPKPWMKIEPAAPADAAPLIEQG
jgi:hypothetical protein